jgi:hypothetical protein
LVKDVSHILNDDYKSDKELYLKDLSIAKQAFKNLRISEIRAYNNKKAINDLNNYNETFKEIE